MGNLHPGRRRRQLNPAPPVRDSSDGSADRSELEPNPLPRWTLVLGALFGAVAGAFEIFNTSIGWHLASGRWMLQHRSVLTDNPFTLGADHAPWLDHEWLFQVAAALLEHLGSAPALILLRMAVAIALVLLLTSFARRGGLAPGAALVLAAACVWGARMRLFVRPELATLLLLPLALFLYLGRHERPPVRTAGWLALITAVGVNFHAAILILPFILVALAGVEVVSDLIGRRSPWPTIRSAAALITAVIGGALINPWGWRTLAAPFHLAHLVGRPWVPNPEWISPGPADVPALWVAIVLSIAVMVRFERNPVRWMLLAVITFLALRYVRNVGLFFVILPLAVSPALARIRWCRLQGRTAALAASLLICLLGARMIDAPGFPFGFGYSQTRYPFKAGRFLESAGLLARPMYNDVRFGGWLIGRYYPPFRPLIDDRNEIHAGLLKRMWEIQQASAPGRWQSMLEEYGIESALLRYHDPLDVFTPDGRPLGVRGYSALWFPSSRWALVYWDDTAMVLVDRTKSAPELLQTFEYRWIRPDDHSFQFDVARSDPAFRAGLLFDLRRKLATDAECRTARWLLNRLDSETLPPE